MRDAHFFFRQPGFLVAAGLLLLAAAGCGKNGAAGASGNNNAALVASGKAVFDANGCTNCHRMNGQGSGRAPDLAHVGGEAEHTADWLVAHVKNPRAHNPRSRMPSFEGKIKDADLLVLGAYLASLK